MVGWHYRLTGHESGQSLGDGEGQGSLACCSPCACVLSSFSCVRLFVTPWTVGCQAPLSMGFSRQEYWSGLPFPSPGDLPDPGIEPASLMSPALVGGFFIRTLLPMVCSCIFYFYYSLSGRKRNVSKTERGERPWCPWREVEMADLQP